MATTILPFVIPKRAPVRARLAGAQATIIIFPGVRYEMYGERGNAAPKGGGAASASRKGKAR